MAITLNPQFTANRPQFRANSRPAFRAEETPSLDLNDVAEINKAVDDATKENPGLKKRILGKFKGIPKKINKAFANKIMKQAKEAIKQMPEEELMQKMQTGKETIDKMKTEDFSAMLDKNPATKNLSSKLKSKLVKGFEQGKKLMKSMTPEKINKVIDQIKNGEVDKTSFSGKKPSFGMDLDKKIGAACLLGSAALFATCFLVGMPLGAVALTFAFFLLLPGIVNTLPAPDSGSSLGGGSLQ